MADYDELAAEAPEWSADIIKALAKGRNDDALRRAREQLVLSKESGDVAGETAATRFLAKAQLAKGDPWSARRTVTEALSVAKSSTDKKAIASLTRLLAAVDLQDRKLEDAVSGAAEAERLYKSLGFKAGIGAAAATMASAYVAREELDKAQEAADSAITIFKEIGDRLGEAFAMKALLEMKMSEDRFFHATIIVEEMLKLYQRTQNLEGQAIAQFLAAEIWLAQGDLQKVMETAEEASDLYEKIGNSKKKAAVILVMAKAFEQGGQLQDARRAAEVASQIYQQSRDKRGQASSLALLASYLATGEEQFGEAAYKYDEASLLYKQIKDKKEETMMMAEVVSMQLQTFESEASSSVGGASKVEARELVVEKATRVLELLDELRVGRSVEYGRALLALARAHFSFRDKARNQDGAEKALEALSIFEELDDLSGQSKVYYHLGLAQQVSGDFDAAMESMEKSQEFAKEAGDVAKPMSKKIKELVKAKATKGVKGTTDPRQDIIIFTDKDAHFVNYDTFQGRSMTVAAPKTSSLSIKDGGAGFHGPIKKKVLYNLRMQRLPSLDFSGASKAVFATA